MIEQSTNKKRVVCFLVGFFILVVIRVFIYNAFDSNIANETVKVIVGHIFRLFVWVVPVFIYLIFIDRTNPFKFLKLSTSFKKGLLWSLVIVAVGAIWQIFEILFRGDIIGHISFISILSLIIVPLFEEIVMRGFVLNKLAEFMSFTKALFISAGFFLLIHLPGWFLITPVKPIGQMLIDSIAVFIIVGLAGGILMKKSNSLYPSITLHLINNFISSV